MGNFLSLTHTLIGGDMHTAFLVSTESPEQTENNLLARPLLRC